MLNTEIFLKSQKAMSNRRLLFSPGVDQFYLVFYSLLSVFVAKFSPLENFYEQIN